MLTEDELEKALANSPAERVTKEFMEGQVTKREFHRLDATTTICSLTLKNGYSVRGESACVNVENYNKDIGEKISYNRAFEKLWPLYGFLLAEKNMLANKALAAA